MLTQINIENILFLDIETVPAYPHYEDVPGTLKILWDKKAGYIKKSESETSEMLYQRAGIYAEFGKIVCISVGFFRGANFRVKSFFDSDEKFLLSNFSNLLNKYFNTKRHLLCAHNGKEFDFPYIARRMLIHELKLPFILQIAGKKPWEVAHIDTLELWKFGDYKHYTSLNLLACIFGIPSPKDDVDGSDIAKIYWQDNDIHRIVNYCQKDVITIALLFLKYIGKKAPENSNIVYIT